MRLGWGGDVNAFRNFRRNSTRYDVEYGISKYGEFYRRRVLTFYVYKMYKSWRMITRAAAVR